MKKGRTRAEVDQVTACLTGYTLADLARLERSSVTCAHFFQRAPAMNPDRALITDKVCGVRVWDLLIRDIRYLGKLVELADSYELTFHSVHPYTRSLISAIPVADPKTARESRRIVLEGDVPSPLNPPSGCRFRTRCPYADERCAAEVPEFKEVSSGHWAACHHLDKVK